MKKKYALGGIPTARGHKVEAYDDTAAFISEVGYPVIAKLESLRGLGRKIIQTFGAFIRFVHEQI